MDNILSGNSDAASGFGIYDYTFSYITTIDKDQDHYHHCYKLVVSLGVNFDCLIDGQQLLEVRGLIINQIVPHSFCADPTKVLVTLIKTESFYGAQIKQLLSGQAFLNLNSILHPRQFVQVFPPNHNELPNSLLTSILRAFLNSIVFYQHNGTSVTADKRIQRALQYIEQNLHESLYIKDIAIEINLSRHRTRHLFSVEMYGTVCQHILWRRLRKTLDAVLTDDIKLTDACLKFGFSDQSHFNHAFRQIFGIRPRELTRHARLLL